MVFESLVADLLNKFIGDYVENLDKSQLKLGIWGGKLILKIPWKNLYNDAVVATLDGLYLLVVPGASKLILKIPWKNLYNDAVVATLDGLCLLVVPGASIKYDAAKEEKYLQEAKQKELLRIEEALQMAAARENPKDEKKDSFQEKLLTQVIKNLQVKITNIHIRYEDDLNSVNQGGQQPLSPSFNSLEEIMDRAYEKFDLELQSVQLLYCKSDRSKTSGMIKLLSSAAGETGSPLVNVNTSSCEEVTKVLLSFEIKKVVVKLTKPVKEKESPFLVLHVSKLGTETRVRNYDLSATAYLKKINMKYLGFTGEPLNIIRSSDEPGADLLKVEYCKADKNGPDFKTVYNNTEQKISVAFSSLDLLLHTQALLSSINFLTAAMSSSSLPSADKERDSKIQAEEQSKSSAIKPVSAGSETDGDVIDLKLTAKLGAFNVLICDENCDIADVRIRDWMYIANTGSELLTISIVMCPVHNISNMLQNFSNNFQTAKEALSVATAQAAEKAASSVRDFAQKSFRLSMDIKLKAPVIIIPQSSVSQNAVEADLGLITVQNQFCLVPADGCSLPPVIDKMDVQLTKLKLSRILLQEGSVQPNIELLQPVNLRASVKRNLAAAWYQKIPAIEINGDLKPMKVALSQDDLTVLLKIVMENIGEAAKPQTETKTSADSVQKQGGAQDGSDLPKGSAPIKKEESNVLDSKEPYETLKFDFNFESLSLVLYNSDPTLISVAPPLQKAPLSQRQDSLRLGEFILHLMTASGKMFEDGALEASTKLTACTLDDCRQGIQRVTSRMVDKKDDGGDSVMIDLSFTQSQSESSVVAVLQKLYVCASVEFLLAVADFFIKAMPQGPTATPNKSNQLQLKQVNVPRAASEKAPDSSRSKMKIKAVVIDPEVVFVASLMKADAPALAASFQCDFTLVSEGASQKMTASLRELKVLACPFLRDKGDKAVTTVLRPACLTFETRMHQTEPLTAAVTVDAIIVKISPMILNTVMTIVAAMTPKAQEVGSQQKTEDVSNLWAVKNLNNCSYWFLGVDMASEVTMESGLGHRTVPLLLAESSFKGKAQDWTSLLNISADMTLEVHYYNEVQAAWEPLIERVEDGRRRWNLKLEMKNNPIQDKSPVPGDDFVVLPEAQTAINICSKDTMNITISKCCLHVFTNLAKAFSEGTATTFDHSLKEKAPYTIKNALGIPLEVQHSSNLRALGSGAKERIHEVGVGQSVKLEYAVIEHIHRGRLSALQRQESCLFSLSIVPSGYSEIANIPVAKPSRRLYNVRSPMFEDAVSVVTQIDATEGNKVITVRSPLQIKNHFSIPFAIYKLSMKTRSLEPVGKAEPEKEFHVPLDSYRCQLFLRPVGMLDGQFKESSTFIAWKEELHRSSEVRAVLQCPSSEINYLPLIVNTVAVPDELSFISSHGEEDWDPAYLIHLRPTVTIRNLLPYTICYLLEGAAETHELAEGSSADVHSARISGEIMELVLVKYQGRNWSGHMKIHEGLPEFFLVCFTSNSLDSLSVDLSVHVGRVSGQMVLSVFSPYWIINKTSRVLQYRAEEIQIKHPSDFRDVILFSFKKKNIFSKNKVNFTKFPMEMRHPFACNIRRNFLSGIQAEFKQSPHQRSLRAQVHWLQVDNQLPGAIFPIVFHPVPPPKSIALDSEPKPFIDVSIITRFNEHSQVMQFKYFMALVQEMALKIDQGFLGAIIALFTPATDLQADKQKIKLIEQDLEALKTELMETSVTDTSGLGFFEHLHISPIKLHLSLSLDSGEESDKQDMVAIQSINLLLKSIGATLTDVDDLIFKLACFEVRYQFYRRDQLMWTVSRHYGEQFLKQVYVLVLGLDVLGNPFGLIRGLSEGVEAFFYEPFQGAVQGPEEFAEGFVIGVRSLLGHTVGGAAGVVSRITGSVGKGLAAITMDKEYQQKRREEMNRQPKDFGDSLAKGGKGLLWMVAESTEEVSKIRPPRLIREDGIIRPFNQGDAEGYDLFQRSEINKLEGELFREHCKVPGSRKTSLVVTNRRVMCLKEIDFVDHINKDWECLFENFTRPPSLQGSSLNIYTKDQGIKMFQNKDSQDSMREVPLQNPDIARKMCSVIDEAKTSRQQHQLVKQKSRRFIKQNTLP
ncbi:UNVERIFIED_CONTAM: hypothetical protein FKN15_065568 [Acipenser sinensis]